MLCAFDLGYRHVAAPRDMVPLASLGVGKTRVLLSTEDVFDPLT